ncbi:uncharacterized protein LOC131874223 [Cryptomeria japonica]|uniref:uncharacterized protein LOC131874223 n=1 Tax=Cryptomeria japonica TaxID=3369 RepID=UPI0027DAB48D|nr:uncharacterized protein LOC131874223 [Cryptomeria japonica]
MEIESTLTKTINLHRKDWAARLLEAVWAYRTSWKTTTRFTPFEMLYRKKAIMPIEFELKNLRTTIELGMDITSAQQARIMQLNELDGVRTTALQNTKLLQNQRIKWHDKYIKDKNFQSGDWALLYDSRLKLYRKTSSKEVFLKQFNSNSDSPATSNFEFPATDEGGTLSLPSD